MKNDNILYWLWLSEACGVACKEFSRLMEHYENPFDLYRLEVEEIEQMAGISTRLKEKLARKSLESSYAILKTCRKEKIDVIPYTDPRYPSRLRTIEDPPVLLYCKGRMPKDMDFRLCIGMVGTRKMSEYGKQTSYKIAYELAGANMVIVSGMASGIDGVCACGVLAAGGDTVAVLGSGLCRVYPKEHKALMDEIVKKGAVISEYPPDERPFGSNFPKRNRLISGLCQGVLVIEGPTRSGALITASKAMAQGREVFALPGKVGEKNSKGPNELIQNEAHVVLSSKDIAEHYDFLYHDVIRYKAFSTAEKKMPPCEKSMARYGVSDLCYEERFDADGPASSTAEKPAAPQRKKARSEDERNATSDQAEVAKPTVPQDGAEQKSDASAEVLSGLDGLTRSVFEQMPLDRAVTPDVFATAGIGIGEAITALTLLELNGLVSSLPGGMYIRK